MKTKQTTSQQNQNAMLRSLRFTYDQKPIVRYRLTLAGEALLDTVKATRLA